MSEPLAPLLAAIGDVSLWLRDEQISGMIIGGVAASLLGRPRTTRDIDLVVWLAEDDWPKSLDSAQRHGFDPRLDDVLDFTRSARVLLLRHRQSGIDVDVALGLLPYEEQAIGRRVIHELDGVNVPLSTPEDLVIMKAVAHRPHDLADIAGLLDAHPQMDVERVLSTVEQFARAVDDVDLLRDLEHLVAGRRRSSD